MNETMRRTVAQVGGAAKLRRLLRKNGITAKPRTTQHWAAGGGTETTAQMIRALLNLKTKE